MTRPTIVAAELALLGLQFGSPPTWGAAAGGLRHDPFVRPRLASLAGPSGATTVRSTGDAPEATDLAPAWQSDLRGVMQAGNASVVNVGGSIVALGETLDGWRLVQVGDGQAVFAKGGKRALVTMLNAGPQKK